MEVKILQLIEGAKNAKGLTVIIDVFRAFSTACYATGMGVKKIIPVGDMEKAYQLKKQYPGYILMGERNEQKPDGFDFGNSPSLLSEELLAGKTVIHTTSSGTQGIASADGADEVITGSFVNAGAIIRYILKKQPETVSLVCMGYACEYPTDEDTLCAMYIHNILKGLPVDFSSMKQVIRNGSGARFFDPSKQSWSPRADYDLCLDLNRFDFILKAEMEDGLTVLKKVMV